MEGGKWLIVPSLALNYDKDTYAGNSHRDSKGKEEPAHKISPAILSLNDQGKLGVRTVTNDNRVEFQEITILEDTNSGMWVSGLGEVARIITLGQEYVFQGQTVRVTETLSPDA